MKWHRKTPEPLDLPSYQPPPPVTVRTEHAPPKDDGIEVEEIDTSDMTKSGIHRAWDRMTGKFKD